MVDEKGRPVQDAHVELAPLKSGPAPADFKRYGAASSPDGRFRILDVPADSWFSLGISQTGFTVLTVEGIVTPRDGGRMALGTFRLPNDQVVAGRVVDSKGHPLAGARVWALSQDNEQWDRFPPPGGGPAAVTGPDGRFELHRFEPGILEVCRRGLSPVHLTPESSTLNRIVLTPPPPPSRISGRVIDDRGLPVPRAKVHLREDPWKLLTDIPTWHPCFPRSARDELVTLSDQEGRFTFELTGAETRNVLAEAAGYLRQQSSQVELSPQSPGKVELVLERGAIVSGRVLTARGFPAANAEISISGERNHDTEPARTDGEGRYRATGIEPGDRTMEVRHPSGQARRKLAVAPGENRRPDLILDNDEVREIRGRVMGPDTGPDGEALAGADVWISYPAALKAATASTSTAADGSFRLSPRRGISEGESLGITIVKPGYQKRLLRLDPATAFPALSRSGSIPPCASPGISSTSVRGE